MHHPHHLAALILISLLYWLTGHAFAKNCGVVGNLYPVVEVDLREVVRQRFLTFQQTGEFDQWQNKLHQDLQQTRDRPQPVVGLHRTLQPRTWFFDPSVRLSYDLKNANGNIILPVGTTVNPLETVSLSKTLLFYNADDPKQVKWAQHQDEELKGKDKLILVGGAIGGQMALFKKTIFFDQGGRLTMRFHITHVPAVILQQGSRLKIQEVSP